MSLASRSAAGREHSAQEQVKPKSSLRVFWREEEGPPSWYEVVISLPAGMGRTA